MSTEEKRRPAAAKKIAIACGGTGGHLFPGIAVAEELQNRGHEIMLLVSEKEVDYRAVEDYRERFVVHHMAAVAMPRGVRGWFGFVLGTMKALRQVRKILVDWEADAVLGMGGFTSMPPLREGARLGLSCFIHDSNSMPGRVSRLAARWADCIFLGMDVAEKFFSEKKVRVTGTPVRAELAEIFRSEERKAELRLQALEKFGLAGEKSTIVVTGGSQGARQLNRISADAVGILSERKNIQVLHLAGKLDYEETSVKYLAMQGTLQYKVLPFCSEMELCFSVADVMVSRAGASSLSEIGAAQVPTVLVPYPFAADDHQKHNADWFVQYHRAVVCDERGLKAEELAEMLAKLLDGETEKNSKKINTVDEPLLAAKKISDEMECFF